MFIIVHLLNGKQVRVNFNHIESYGVITEDVYDAKSKYIGHTYLLPVGMDESQCYIIKETVEEVDSLVLKYFGKELNEQHNFRMGE